MLVLCPLATETLRWWCAAHTPCPVDAAVQVSRARWICAARGKGTGNCNTWGLAALVWHRRRLPLPVLVLRCAAAQPGRGPKNPWLSTRALPCECVAPNSQGWGRKHPAGTQGLKRGLRVHPLLGACTPHVAPRARVPLFRPPRPLPHWDAVVHGGTLLLAPAGNAWLAASRIIPLAEL